MLSRKIDLNLLENLKQREFRTGFFEAELEFSLPQQIRAVRKLRHLRQEDLADAIGTTQSAVARLERVGYARWNMVTLRKIAEALDARLTVTLEPSEIAIGEIAQQLAAQQGERTAAHNFRDRQNDRSAATAAADERRQQTLGPPDLGRRNAGIARA